jgi:large subunit ribosomal protein L35
MPKIKTSSSAKKRFKVTGTGKLLRRRAMKSHNLTKKTSKVKQRFTKDQPVAEANVPALKQMLGKRSRRS